MSKERKGRRWGWHGDRVNVSQSVPVRETETLSIYQSKQRVFLSFYNNRRPVKIFSQTFASPLLSSLQQSSPITLSTYSQCYPSFAKSSPPIPLTYNVQICMLRQQLYCTSADWQATTTLFISCISHLNEHLSFDNTHLQSPQTARKKHMVNKGSPPCYTFSYSVFCSISHFLNHCCWYDFNPFLCYFILERKRATFNHIIWHISGSHIHVAAT